MAGPSRSPIDLPVDQNRGARISCCSGPSETGPATAPTEKSAQDEPDLWTLADSLRRTLHDNTRRWPKTR